MSKLLVVALVVGFAACAPPQGAFKPVTVTVPDDAHGRVIRGVTAAGYSIDTTDEAAGVVTTKWQEDHRTVGDVKRFRWMVSVSGGSLTVMSQCEFEHFENDWRPCYSQPAHRNDDARWLANRILHEPAGTVAKPAPATPRGFFCATAACAREKATCEQARVTAGDATSCTLVELAFCFDLQGAPMCARTSEQCGQQREVAGAASACAQRN